MPPHKGQVDGQAERLTFWVAAMRRAAPGAGDAEDDASVRAEANEREQDSPAMRAVRANFAARSNLDMAESSRMNTRNAPNKRRQ